MKSKGDRVALNVGDVGVRFACDRTEQNDVSILHDDLDVRTASPEIAGQMALERGTGSGANLHVVAAEGQYLDVIGNASNAFNRLHPVVGFRPVRLPDSPAGENHMVVD